MTKRIEDCLNEILQICASEFGVSIEDIKSASRKQEFVYCRKAFCLIVKEKFDLKYEIIARKINRSANQVSVSINTQPDNKYYNFVLHQIKIKIDQITFL